MKTKNRENKKLKEVVKKLKLKKITEFFFVKTANGGKERKENPSVPELSTDQRFTISLPGGAVSIITRNCENQPGELLDMRPRNHLGLSRLWDCGWTAHGNENMEEGMGLELSSVQNRDGPMGRDM